VAEERKRRGLWRSKMSTASEAAERSKRFATAATATRTFEGTGSSSYGSINEACKTARHHSLRSQQSRESQTALMRSHQTAQHVRA